MGDVQREALGILEVFDAVCKTLNLRYSLSGGTLLGAVRHQGFIPWDDDVDVNMPRPDFELFRAAAGKLFEDFGFKVVGMPFDDGCPIYLKLLNMSVAVDEKYIEGDSFLWLDIFPVDGMPDDERRASMVCKRAEILRKVSLLAGADAAHGTTSLRRGLKKLVQPTVRTTRLSEMSSMRLSSLARSIPFGSTGHVGVVVWGYGFGERVSADAFDNLVDVEFEGRFFKAMDCWDEYLTGLYGNYMELPPEGERKTHEVKAWFVGNEEG